MAESKPNSGPADPRDVEAEIAALRRQIDELDRELAANLGSRAALARAIGNCKAERGEAMYAPAREQEVIRRAREIVGKRLPGRCVESVFREIISACRAAQCTIRIAFLGPEYSYSHLAALHRFGQGPELIGVGSIAAVFEEVERGSAEFGLVPIDNSTDGRVADTLDRISRSPVRICGEVPLHIHHCLLALGKRDEITQVCSKPQALSQCRNWLATHLPQAEAVPVSSTSEAARLASADPAVAAVASEPSAAHHGLTVLARNIEDQPDNITRFAVISDAAAEPTGDDKTALMFEISHQPGALADALAVLKENSLNATWIESFPIPGSRGRYHFFVEFEGHQSERNAARAIGILRESAQRLEILGSYARTDPVG